MHVLDLGVRLNHHAWSKVLQFERLLALQQQVLSSEELFDYLCVLARLQLLARFLLFLLLFRLLT